MRERERALPDARVLHLGNEGCASHEFWEIMMGEPTAALGFVACQLVHHPVVVAIWWHYQKPKKKKRDFTYVQGKKGKIKPLSEIFIFSLDFPTLLLSPLSQGGTDLHGVGEREDVGRFFILLAYIRKKS